jgi:hypothetical protein
MVYRNGGKIKSTRISGDADNLTHDECKQIIDDNPKEDFVFIDVNNKNKDITQERLLDMIRHFEKRTR